MDRVLIMVISMVIGVYIGIAYVGHNLSSEKRLDNIEGAITTLNDKFDKGLTITIKD